MAGATFLPSNGYIYPQHKEQYLVMTQEQQQTHESHDVNVYDPASRKKTDTYQASDIAELYKRAQPKNWEDLKQFVDTQGDSTWHITPGEAVAISNAVRQALQNHVPFKANPEQAYSELSKFGTQGSVESGKSKQGGHNDSQH